jgi:nucleotidyltransferase/DNA polymerase involved in DNA repair
VVAACSYETRKFGVHSAPMQKWFRAIWRPTVNTPIWLPR